VIAHLGNGASMVAVREGQPLDTTMGFTPSGGFMMGMRSGDLDPGVLLHLLVHEGWDAAALFGFASRGEADFQDRLLSAMRFEFGGHVEEGRGA
jgi:hypothetical protein